MKTTEKLKDQIFRQIQASGLFKQMQSKLKTQVLSMVERESNPNKVQMGFQYQHPLLNKLRKYPLTSLCMDLIQQFLQSFKFKYTLNVFKKQINREINMNRSALSNNFKIQMKNADSQAVLLSIVNQLVSGDIKIDTNKQANNNPNAFVNNNWNQNATRVNNFIGGNGQIPTNYPNQQSDFNKKNQQEKNDGSLNSLNNNSQTINNTQKGSNSASGNQKSSNQGDSKQSSSTPILNTSSNSGPQKQKVKQTTVKKQEQVKQKQTPEQQKPKKKPKVEAQKRRQDAEGLLGELMNKVKSKKQQEEVERKKKQEQLRKAYSQPKVEKKVDPNERGQNKIRGMSVGKASSLMNKFFQQPSAPVVKNQSFIEEEMDEFQQSKDSTRKNPLFSSTQSGFDKSGFYDQSVDSNAIEDYEYREKAKKFNKKF